VTENVQKKQNPARILVLGFVALIVVGGIVFAMVQRNAGGSESAAPTSTATSDQTATDADDEGEDDVSGMTPGPSLAPTTFLKESMGGQEAIDALGDRIDVVAQRNGKTVEELTDLLLRDSTAFISPKGFLGFKDDFGKNDS